MDICLHVHLMPLECIGRLINLEISEHTQHGGLIRRRDCKLKHASWKKKHHIVK